MTNISTTATLDEALRSTKLVLYEAELDGDEAVRRGVVLWKGLRDELFGNHKKPELRKYFSKTRTVLNQFCKDRDLDAESGYLKPLTGYDDPTLAYQWELKILLAPQSRIFGKFIGLNKFVALSHSPREKCDFDFHMARVRERWDQTLSGEPGVRSYLFKDVIA